MKESKNIFIRLDGKLYKQLKKYSDENNEGNISMSARKGIRLLLKKFK